MVQRLLWYHGEPSLNYSSTAGCVHWKYCPRCIVKIHLKPEDVLIFIFVKKKELKKDWGLRGLLITQPSRLWSANV